MGSPTRRRSGSRAVLLGALLLSEPTPSSHTVVRRLPTRLWHTVAPVVPSQGRAFVRRMGQRFYTSRLSSSTTVLTAYPKSGSTWLCNMLATIMAGGEVPPDRVADVVPGLASIHRRRAADAIYVTHNSLLTPGMKRAGRRIMLVRDPRAVAVSYAKHRQRRGDDMSVSAAVDELLGNGFLELGSWQEHIESGLAMRDSDAAMLVRYEDLRAAPGDVLDEMGSYLGWSPSPRLIDMAVEMNALDRLRERRFAVGMDDPDETIQGVRLGSTTSWVDECPPEAQRRVVSELGSLLQLLDYPT